ncbi:MAG: fibronectin type III domain-containing protein [Clostridia bacterium]|nr:fibronectin type III domain-containing protein [Clostridia bacterium]
MKTMKKLLAAFLCALMLLSVFVFQGSAVKFNVGKPENLKATSTMYSVTLSWKEYKGFGTVIYQQVSGKWKQIKWFEASHIYTTTSYTVNELKPNTTYKFAVRHHMGKNNMSSYSYVTVKTKKEAVNIKLYSAEASNVTLYWNKLRDADGYYIYKRVNDKWKKIGNVWEESCTITGLTADTKYKFAVKPYYITGSSSKAAKFYGQISVRTSKELGYVQSFVVKGTEEDISITWDSLEGATGYRLYIKKGEKGAWERVDTFKSNVTGYMIHERSADEKWYFRIRAYAKGSDGIIWGPYSTREIDMVDPLKADILMSDSTQDSITVNWRRVEQATGYEVYVNLGRASSYYSYEKVADIDSNDITSYTATELECDESYPFKIRAYKTEEDGTVTYYPYGAEYRVRTTKKTVDAYRVENLKKKLDAENVCFKFRQYTYEGSIRVDYVFARTKGKIFLRETYGDNVTEYLYSEKTDRTYIIFDSTKRYTIAPEGSGYKEMLFMFDELIRIGEIEGVTAYDDSEFDGYSSICETYTDAVTAMPMRYYFDDDGNFEGFCISENDDPETIFISQQLKSKASSSVFSVPKKYQYVKYNVLY